MQLHELKPNNKIKKKKRVGRGGKRGTYSGRGLKGQKSRAGRRIRPQLRDVIKKIPKKRGYKFKSVRTKLPVVNIESLNKIFNDEEKINPLKIFKAGLVSKKMKVKILGNGETAKKFFISGCEISSEAKNKIIKAGGEIKI